MIEFPVLQAPGRTACTLTIPVSKKESLQNPLTTERLVSGANNCMLLLRKSTRAQWVHFAAHISQQVLLVAGHMAFLILQGC